MGKISECPTPLWRAMWAEVYALWLARRTSFPTPFELPDFEDLIRLLRDHPEWCEELRALLLTLPALVRELAETVAQLTVPLEQLTETVARLAEGQERVEVQMVEVRGWALEPRRVDQHPCQLSSIFALCHQTASRRHP